MNRQSAANLFTQEISSRWPDFVLNAKIYNDWINFFMAYDESEIIKAIENYVRKYNVFGKPALNHIRDCAIAVKTFIPKQEEDKYPMYFLRTTTGGESAYKQPYSFARIVPTSFSPDNAMRQVQHCKKEYERLYGGEWEVIVCENRNDFGLMLEQRKVECLITK